MKSPEQNNKDIKDFCLWADPGAVFVLYQNNV